jgi:hypothetical protein
MNTDQIAIFVRREIEALNERLEHNPLGDSALERLQFRGYRIAYANVLALIMGEEVWPTFNNKNREEGAN